MLRVGVSTEVFAVCVSAMLHRIARGSEWDLLPAKKHQHATPGVVDGTNLSFPVVILLHYHNLSAESHADVFRLSKSLLTQEICRRVYNSM